jgi:hypothetical protein
MSCPAPTTTAIPLHHLLVQPDEPPMHGPAILALLDGSRTDPRPVEVVRVAGTPHYRITNGRHRFLAAVLRADPSIDCVITDN